LIGSMAAAVVVDQFAAVPRAKPTEGHPKLVARFNQFERNW
jgi:hypothetical protein